MAELRYFWLGGGASVEALLDLAGAYGPVGPVRVHRSPAGADVYGAAEIKVSEAEARGEDRVSISGGRTSPTTVVRESGHFAYGRATAGGEVGLPGGNVSGDEGADVATTDRASGTGNTPAPGEPPGSAP